MLYVLKSFDSTITGVTTFFWVQPELKWISNHVQGFSSMWQAWSWLAKPKQYKCNLLVFSSISYKLDQFILNSESLKPLFNKICSRLLTNHSLRFTEPYAVFVFTLLIWLQLQKTRHNDGWESLMSLQISHTFSQCGMWTVIQGLFSRWMTTALSGRWDSNTTSCLELVQTHNFFIHLNTTYSGVPVKYHSYKRQERNTSHVSVSTSEQT